MLAEKLTLIECFFVNLSRWIKLTLILTVPVDTQISSLSLPNHPLFQRVHSNPRTNKRSFIVINHSPLLFEECDFSRSKELAFQ